MTDTTQATTLMGPKILLEGPSGTGKTHALGTLVDWAAAQKPALPVFVLFTETAWSPFSDTGAITGRKFPPIFTGTSQ